MSLLTDISSSLFHLDCPRLTFTDKTPTALQRWVDTRHRRDDSSETQGIIISHSKGANYAVNRQSE